MDIALKVEALPGARKAGVCSCGADTGVKKTVVNKKKNVIMLDSGHVSQLVERYTEGSGSLRLLSFFWKETLERRLDRQL